MSTTIYDIAKKAGVSTAAVSMALNNKKGVSEKTRTRILDIASDLNYQPNYSALSLSTQKSRNVVLFISAVNFQFFDSSFYFSILSAISQNINNDFFLITRISTIDKEAEDIAQIANSEKPLAFVFIGTRLSIDFIHRLINNTPAIFFNKPNLKGKNVYSVSFDNTEAMEMITEHMLKLGHRKIAYAGYLPGVITAEKRLEGFYKALSKNGIQKTDSMLIKCEYLPIFGYEAVKRLIVENEELPSAFVCGNDLIAVGIMQALREYNFKVPEDISIAGIDNLLLSDSLWVPLTTIDVKCQEIGAQIANLIRKIADNEIENDNITIQVSLVKRESSGKFNPTGKRKRIQTEL